MHILAPLGYTARFLLRAWKQTGDDVRGKRTTFNGYLEQVGFHGEESTNLIKAIGVLLLLRGIKSGLGQGRLIATTSII